MAENFKKYRYIFKTQTAKTIYFFVHGMDEEFVI